MVDNVQWTGNTYGSRRMHQWLIGVLRIMDVRMLYLFAAIFIVPVCLVVRPSYGIIYRFFRKRLHYSSIKACWKTYVNHCLFSQVVIDRFAMYAGKHFHVEIEGYHYFEALAGKKEGFVVLSSHVGNYELAGYTLAAEDKPINALVFGGEKQSVMENRNKLLTRHHIKMIPISADMSHLFLIERALSDGEIMSMPADRIFGSRKTIEKTFLGEKAQFPLGPFRVATMKGLRVLAVNVMKTSMMTYKAYVVPLDYDQECARDEQIQQLSDAYVGELERIVRAYPAQWYNYFDFWTK